MAKHISPGVEARGMEILLVHLCLLDWVALK
jgi:hypothetical protein